MAYTRYALREMTSLSSRFCHAWAATKPSRLPPILSGLGALLLDKGTTRMTMKLHVMTMKRTTILLCSVALAALASSAVAKPHHRYQAVQTEAQTDAADSDARYSAASAPAAAAEAVPRAGQTLDIAEP